MAGSQGIRAGKAFVELYANDSKLTRGLRAAQRKLKHFSTMVTNMGAKLAGFASIVAVPLSFTIRAASDMEETMNKFNVVFGENSKAVKDWSDNFARDVGRSKQQVADFMAGSQDLFVPLGFEPGAATEMSKQITSLAVDLASFNNKADADVIRDLHAALTGSGEVMKKYGVLVSEAAVKQELLRTGMDPKTATDQQKVMARLSIIMQGTTAAQGDAIRSAGAYANQMKRLMAVVSDAATEIGKALLPTVTELVKYAADVVTKIANWVKENQGLVKVIAVVTAVIGTVGGALLALGAAAGIASFAIGGLITAGGAIAGVFSFLSLPVLAVVAAIAAAVAGVAAFTSWLIKSGDVVKQFGRLVMAVFNAFVTFVSTGPLAVAAKLLWASLKVVWVEGIGDLNKTWDKLKEAWSEVTDSFVSDWKSAIGEVKKEMKGLNDEVNKPKKAGGNGGGGAAGGGSGIRFDFGLWGEWYDNFMNPPGIPANEGVIETFAMRPEDINQGGKKTNPADNVPIMPEFAPEPPGEDPETKAAKEKLSELQQELAKLSIDDSSAKSIRSDIGGGSALGKLVNTINAAGAGRTMEQLARDGNSLQAEAVRILDIMKRRMENGGDFAEAG